MDIEKEKLVILNEDDKAVALKWLSKIHSTTAELYSEIKDNELTEKMKNILFQLIEGYTADAAKTLKYDSKALAEREKKNDEIRRANLRIHELEEMLVTSTQVTGVKELLYAMQNALYDWWSKQGYNLVTDDEFGGYGYKGRFCLDTSYISFESTRPVTEKKEHQSRLEEMMEEGYEFAKEGKRHYVLIDTPKNRELITKLVKDKFQSIDIYSWENRKNPKSSNFHLSSFRCYIRDLNEIKALMDEIKQTPEGED